MNEQEKWYVVKAVSGKEKKVKEALEIENEARPQNLIQEILIPAEKVHQIKNGKKYLREKNFFPGYVFIKSKYPGEIGYMLKGINYAQGLLENGRSLRKHEVEKFLGKIDEEVAQAKMACEFQRGESVKITEGPFNSFNGEVEEIDEEKGLLKLAVKIFGRKTPLELKYEQVTKEY
jgi:transcription termination/antitermination protein NusG